MAEFVPLRVTLGPNPTANPVDVAGVVRLDSDPACRGLGQRRLRERACRHSHLWPRAAPLALGAGVVVWRLPEDGIAGAAIEHLLLSRPPSSKGGPFNFGLGIL